MCYECMIKKSALHLKKKKWYLGSGWIELIVAETGN